MKQLDIPGAVVVVTHGDRVLLKSGFGVARRETSEAVDPDRTSFRVASVAKVFTALAVLRVVERGRIALTDDVRSMVRDIPLDPDAAPITLHALLTHTAGFDEQMIGYLNPVGATSAPLDRYLAAEMPARSRASDRSPGYSNHGYALAGLVVERVTHQPFDAFVRDSVLARIGMKSTRFVREARDTAGLSLAAEYRSDGRPRELRTSRPYPAGNIATSGGDMVRFLVALDGALHGDSSRGIAPSEARRMVGSALVYHESMPPMGYGFAASTIAGQTMWEKGGASPSHTAAIVVLPERRIGIFIAANRQEPTLWDRLVRDAVARAYSDSTKVLPAATRPESVAGTYRWNRAPLRSVEKILGLAAQLTVVPTSDGVRIDGPGILAGSYTRLPNGRYGRRDGRPLAFELDSSDVATHAFSILEGQPVTFERIGRADQARTQLAVAGLGTALAIIAAGVALSIKRRPDAPRWARTATIALPLAELAMAGAAIGLASQVDALSEGPTPLLRVMLLLANAVAAVAAIQIVGAGRLASLPTTGAIRRTMLIAGAAGGLGLIWFLSANNLVAHWR